ncbi:PREDICTED: tyrosine-sulfated glycopeptide receptor 1 [Nicotiana attenuata]|uniref:non-specific serine/threonine protein kinase n=1 Tax=Nicotiana attenuata TaxID=49451 RepID=A0A1J6J2M9_NICAT|nr:PREDICTED: tyrosine-sulfated glycopeptide receptor 1 [Nicotiana attenuata]OIT05203.1 tyrosine-sulfated glycopeptide receptor 1 [Nicotiana attenuata]
MITDNKDSRHLQSGLTYHQFRAAMLLTSLHSSSSSSSLPHHNSFYLITVTVVLLISSVATICHASCNQLDRDSLLSFSVAISSPSPLNWSSSTDCCTWEGVGCDNSGRVISLLLPSRSLLGSIRPSIANLSKLSQLSLSHNRFFGPLPDGFFESFSSLQIIDLSYNRLSGQLPLSDRLPSPIQLLNLSSNHFNGTIRSSFLELAINLVSFDISNNSFSGQIPSFICSYSAAIRVLDFSSNEFVGQIPKGFGSCSNLVTLRAGFNHLSGSIPDDIYSVSTLQEIFLPANKFSGPIPEGIVNLANLRILALYGNELTGLIPQDIGRLTRLEQLLLHINFLNGTVPPSLMACTRLTVLNLRVNFLEGELSALDFSNLSRLSTIDLGNNFFTGSIPQSLFSCRSLTAIRLATNKLTGDIMPGIMSLQSLSFLSVSNNSLTNFAGAIEVLKGCKNLTTLILTINFYNETLPDDGNLIGSEDFQNLQILGLGGCNFTGQIPTWLVKLRKLEVLDLSMNQITGKIPGWLGTLQNLFYMDLSQNLLYGGVPIELTQLQRLASEGAADQIERSALELPVFVQPNNASNQQYNQLSNLPPAIYLGHNRLDSIIPTEIGQLKYILVLDLSNNNFSGNIPETISNLTNLEKLDLSGNNLSGEIPSSLKGLHFLSSFSVAHNNLEGPIPTGGQFDTFPVTSFLGNPGLCGQILQHSCTDQSATTQPSAVRKSPKMKIIIGLILGISFGIALALIVTALWIFSKRRILPRGDAEKNDLDIVSYNSTSGLSAENGKDNSMLVMFPTHKNQIKDLTIFDILKATNNFNQANIIGCGGFGLVYKATLADGTTLAVKKLSGDMGLIEREFRAEVEALSTAQHENLVSLEGYCVHDGCRLLFYSYMENGSLDYWLHEKTDGASLLDWPTRLKIAQGASFGLAYMHQICEPHIVHRDIKSSNILLDEKFKAHVADFGLSRLILPYHTHVTTELVGTLGYIPPEYSQSWIATLRGDVYSFGVVMLELLAGRRPVDMTKPKMSRELVVWVQQMRNQGKQEEIFDPLLRDKGFEEEMLNVLDVACMCVNHNPFKRPAITEVVEWLREVGSKREAPN